MSQPIPLFHGGQRTLLVSGGLALLGAVVLVLGGLADATRVFHSYLAAYACVVSTAVGALIFLMICHAMRATWPVAVRRLNEAIVASLPILAVLFIPLLFGLDPLYRAWLRPDLIEDEHLRSLIQHKQPYLNVASFLVRTVVYFIIWIGCGALLRGWSLRADRDPSLAAPAKSRALSAGALPLVALAITFASFDWLMSLTPTWSSSMFPVYVFAGGFVSAIALLTLLAFLAQRGGLLPDLSTSHYYALGRLLLSFTIFWAYAAFFQFMLIWIANRPEEAEFYVHRAEGPWDIVSVILVFAQFVVPFVVLLNYRVKRRPAWLSAIAIWLLVAHYIDVHWLVVPQAPGHHPAPYHWLDLAALALVAGATVAFVTFRMRGKPLAPINDPALPAAYRYESL